MFKILSNFGTCTYIMAVALVWSYLLSNSLPSFFRIYWDEKKRGPHLPFLLRQQHFRRDKKDHHFIKRLRAAKAPNRWSYPFDSSLVYAYPIIWLPMGHFTFLSILMISRWENRTIRVLHTLLHWLFTYSQLELKYKSESIQFIVPLSPLFTPSQ